MKTFSEGLNNEKYIQIVKYVAKHYSTSGFCMQKDYSNIMKWLQIHGTKLYK